ncbi:hypothetical protein WJX82_000904 [Trebouxia sp. C0006]
MKLVGEWSSLRRAAGTGVGQSNGLCTTFPAAGGWMSFRCSGSNDLASALKQSSAVKYFVSQLPDGQIEGSEANATIPAGLQPAALGQEGHITQPHDFHEGWQAVVLNAGTDHSTSAGSTGRLSPGAVYASQYSKDKGYDDR